MRTRITALFTLVTLLWMSVAFAAPAKLSQQGRLLDGDGTPLSDGHGMTFSLHDAETDGNEVWREERVVQFEEGYYSIVLGELVPLDDLLFASSAVWLQLAATSIAYDLALIKSQRSHQNSLTGVSPSSVFSRWKTKTQPPTSPIRPAIAAAPISEAAAPHGS